MPEPRSELMRGLAVFAEPPRDGHETVAAALGLPCVPDAAAYSDVFVFQLYPYASVHLGPEGMMGGGARDRVAGFWRAVGREPPAEPDHLAALLGLYAALDPPSASVESRALARGARRALLDEHLVPWVFLFLDRVEELAASTYGAWARLLRDALRAEVVGHAEATGAEPDDRVLSAHLRAAGELPDPRGEGSAALVTGLLAPARCGALLTRADLARIAGRLDLGLRAGERRYALEHLLAQDAPSVLEALARECRRQAALHEAHCTLLGHEGDVDASAPAFLSRRAIRSARLLESLAREASAELRPAAR